MKVMSSSNQGHVFQALPIFTGGAVFFFLPPPMGFIKAFLPDLRCFQSAIKANCGQLNSVMWSERFSNRPWSSPGNCITYVILTDQGISGGILWFVISNTHTYELAYFHEPSDNASFPAPGARELLQKESFKGIFHTGISWSQLVELWVLLWWW